MDKLLLGAQICCQCRKDEETRTMSVKGVSRPKDFLTKSSPRGLAGTGACFLLDPHGSLVFRVAAPASSASEAAAEGLLKEGDVLVKVDGEDMQGKHISELASRLLGPPNTTVRLTFRRGNSSFNLNLERRLP